MICQCLSQWIILWLNNLTTNGVIPSRPLFINVGSVHQPHNVGAPIKASLAAADWLKRSSVASRVRYAGCIPADEPLVLIRRTFGLFRGTPQRYPSSCICIQGPQACSARWALNNNDRYPPTFSCTPSSQYISTHQEASL